jgi:hypothetical protein
MRISILFICAFAMVSAKAQTSLPGPDSLFAAIDSFYSLKLEAELKAFESNPKDYWMNFVPGIGLGYNLQGKPRPTFSYSLSSLLNVRTQKRQVTAMRESILLKNQLEKQENKIQVSNLLKKIEILKSDLEFSFLVFEIDRQIFEVYQKKNQNQLENLDFSPTDFLLKKKDFLNKQQNIRLEKREIELLFLALLETSHLKL